MADVICRNLALLTLLAALVGGLVSTVFQWRLSHSKVPLTVEELVREIETGNNVPFFAASDAIRQLAESTPNPARHVALSSRDHAELFIADKFAMMAFTCETSEDVYRGVLDSYGRVWFRGAVSGAFKSIQASSGELSGDITLVGPFILQRQSHGASGFGSSSVCSSERRRRPRHLGPIQQGLGSLRLAERIEHPSHSGSSLPAASAPSNSPSITHLASCQSPSQPTSFSDGPS